MIRASGLEQVYETAERDAVRRRESTSRFGTGNCAFSCGTSGTTSQIRRIGARSCDLVV